MNFLGLQGKAADYSRARAVVLSAPYEKTCTFGLGAAQGPEAVIQASVEAEWYDEELDLALDEIGIATLPAPSLEKLNPEEMVEQVYGMAQPVVQAGKIPAGLGGEHTVSLGYLKAVLDRFPGLSVLQIDAHPDLRNEYQGRSVCHATVGRRIMERCPLVQVGIRAYSVEERRFLENQVAAPAPRVRPFSSLYLHQNPGWIDEVVASLSDAVYITVDVDGLDPSLIPHTGTPEPGGLSWRETCDLLQAVALKRKIVGFDLVELAPERGSRSSDFTVARLCTRLIGLSAGPGRPIPKPPF